MGLGIYVTVDIGVDAFTGMVLYLRDATQVDLKYVKIVFDIALILMGTLMGGTLGVATFVTMLVAGSMIQCLSKRFQALYFHGKVEEEKRSMEERRREEQEMAGDKKE